MECINHTPFPVEVFETLDQYRQAFHVAVLRQTLSFASGQLEYADLQAPLCDIDTPFDDGAGMRQESDYCAFKPRCDVIVNAVAHAPGQRATRQFLTRLTVRLPDRPVSDPVKPRGINPLESATTEELARWRQQVAIARQTRLPGAVLLQKILAISGPYHVKKKIWLTRLVQWGIKWSTLTLVRPNPWKLTRAGFLTSLPVRHTFAFGGQCRVNADDKAASKITLKNRLTAQQIDDHPDGAGQAIAHTAFANNVHGRGYMQAWYLKATRIKTLAAPQIAYHGQAWTAARFRRGLNDAALFDTIDPAGLGVRDKYHLARRALAGQWDDAWAQSGMPAPQTFDHAFWNAAAPDQQIDYPQGDEIFELVNLCAPETPGARRDASGNTILALTRPPHQCFLLLTLKNGERRVQPMEIDTIIIEPEQCGVTLVWRTTFAKDDVAQGDVIPIANLEFRMRDFLERQRMRHDFKTLHAWSGTTKDATEDNNDSDDDTAEAA